MCKSAHKSAKHSVEYNIPEINSWNIYRSICNNVAVAYPCPPLMICNVYTCGNMDATWMGHYEHVWMYHTENRTRTTAKYSTITIFWGLLKEVFSIQFCICPSQTEQKEVERENVYRKCWWFPDGFLSSLLLLNPVDRCHFDLLPGPPLLGWGPPLLPPWLHPPPAHPPPWGGQGDTYRRLCLDLSTAWSTLLVLGSDCTDPLQNREKTDGTYCCPSVCIEIRT